MCHPPTLAVHTFRTVSVTLDAHPVLDLFDEFSLGLMGGPCSCAALRYYFASTKPHATREHCGTMGHIQDLLVGAHAMVDACREGSPELPWPTWLQHEEQDNVNC